MRLIDADKLLENFDRLQGNNRDLNWMLSEVIPDMINKQPTAYNVDKVLDELEDNLRREYNGEDEGFNYGIRKAIEIVKRGGNDL